MLNNPAAGVGHLGHRLQHLARHLVAHQPDAFLHRVGAGSVDQFIKKPFQEKPVFIHRGRVFISPAGIIQPAE